MAKNKIGLQFSGFAEMAEKLDKINGDLKKTTSDALLASKVHVTKKLVSVTRKSNYPAKGEYSSGDTRHSIDTSKNVVWAGSTGEIDVGYDFDKNGLTSIFLMYGTPKMAKVQEMYDAIYGKKVQSEIRKIQKNIFTKAIDDAMQG